MNKWYSKNHFSIISYILALLLLLAGCSNNAASHIEPEMQTLKNTITEKSESMLWSKEIEGSLLVENINSKEKTGKVSLSPGVMNLFPEYNVPVYPYIEGFGYLYENNLDEPAFEKIKAFCNAVSEYIYKGPESYIDSSCIFTFVFFLEDIQTGWEKYFGQKFPVQKISQDELSTMKENHTLDKLFSDWIYGAVFEGEDYYEIPVRFFTQKGSVDVILTVSKLNDNKIRQIEISNWEISDAI